MILTLVIILIKAEKISLRLTLPCFVVYLSLKRIITKRRKPRTFLQYCLCRSGSGGMEVIMAKKKSILDLHKMKQNKEKATWVTAYDFPVASFAEQAEINMILVGDSLGMVVLGYDGTIAVTMDECIHHCKAVRRGAPNTFVIGDMPFGSYQATIGEAVNNAVRFLKEANCDAIKLEGGVRVADKIRAISDSGIVVFGHIGLTPQSSGQMGGFKAQGLFLDSARDVIKDALAVQE